MSKAGTISSIPQAAVTATGGMNGETSHSAVPSKTNPKIFLIVVIHGPALGNSAPAESPITSSGAPMPSPMAKSAAPPSGASPVWPM